ncbi:hypothetical protein ACQ4PT_009138 [Festuca glaucescens]
MPVAQRTMTKKDALLIVGVGDEALLPVEDMEHVLDDVLATLARIEAKRGRLQGEVAAASRGRRAPRGRRAAPAPAAAEGNAQPMAPAPAAYTRKGAGAVKKRLRAAAGEAKKEKERLEALWGELQEAIADARQRVALPRAGNRLA